MCLLSEVENARKHVGIGGGMLRGLDIPPSWLAVAAGLAWGLNWLVPELGFGWAWSQVVGTGLVALGLGAMGLALWEMLRARTTFIPRQKPTALVNSGIFRLSRNPIYLGDTLVLAGLILRWDALVALPIVPLFGAWITRRFILGEEAGLLSAFGGDFEEWRSQVRRWI